MKASFREFRPTKTNLLSLQKRLAFAVKGENFLKFKLEQIIYEIKENWDKYTKNRVIFINLYIETMIKLNQTYKEMGKRDFILISNLSKIQFQPKIDIKYTKKIGSLIPLIVYELIREELLPAYSFENSSHYLDDLIIVLIKFFNQLIVFAELEDIMLNMSHSYRKINRRIRGLKNIIIPELQFDIKKIKDILEENERENYVRLKNTKDLITKEI
ncbi:MAG: V-type ATP synthase subunit D [Candidatus Lokiarchaeota archaeon]|nr:V-type ATP synthase subunit D [Candidatus Lokiarchaeota archaeon]